VKTSLGAQNLHSAPSRRGTCSPGKSLCKELWIQKENFRKGRRDSRVSPAERAESATKPWILRELWICTARSVSAAGLMRIFTKFQHWYCRTTAGCTNPSAARAQFLLECGASRREAHACILRYFHHAQFRGSAPKAKGQMQMQSPHPSLPSIRYQICQICRLSHTPQIQGSSALRILLFLYGKNERKKKTHMQFPRNMAISKSRSEALSSPNGTICGGHLARCRRGAVP
jgi:hypothetical protein